MKIKRKILLSVISLLVTGFLSSYAAMTPEASILYQQACSAEHQQDLKTAISKLEEAIKISGGDTMLYTKLAGIYAETDQFDKALEIYEKVININPDDAFIYISIGNIYENQGKYKEALGAYSKALDIFPEYKYNYFNIGNVNYQLKEYKEAVKNYTAFLETYSSHNDARENLAASYLALKDYKNARAQYEFLYNKNKDNFKNNYQYGIALLNTDSSEQAIGFLEKAIEIESENYSAHLGLAQAYQDLGKNDMSYEQYQIVLKNVPNLNTVRLDYANLLAAMDKNTEAIEQYNMYIKAYSKDIKGYIAIADVYKKIKNYDKALENYLIALTMDENNIDLKKDIANCYHNKKEYDNALKYYNEVLISEPDNFNIRFNKALALHALNKYEEAIVIYKDLLSQKHEKVIKENLNNALVSRGHELVGNNKGEEAIQIFKEAIKDGYTEGYVYYGLAKAYRLNGNNTKAAENYEKAISIDPEKTLYSSEYSDFISSIYEQEIEIPSIEDEDNKIQAITVSVDTTEVSKVADSKKVENKPSEVVVKKNSDFISLGDKSFKAKDYDSAIKNYQDALQIIPDDAETLLKLGLIYKLKNDNTRAINFYQKAIIVNPDYTDGWFNLGLSYANENNLIESQKSFEKVISLDPNYNYGYAYYALGYTFEQQGKKSDAVKNYKMFVKKNNDKQAISDVQEKIKQLQ